MDDQVGFAYRFNVDGGEDIFNIDLHLLDYGPALGVSKSTAFTTPYLIDSGVAFGVLPTGMLRVGLIQGPQIALGTYIARGTWSPEPTN